MAVAVETDDPSARVPVAAIVAHLADAAGAGALSGAELAVVTGAGNPRPEED